jgi:RNA polymerase sigma factor (sigma-70 family)
VAAHHLLVGSTGSEPTGCRGETPSADAAFRALYEDRLLPLVRFAHLLTGSNAVAEDLVHDAFLKVRPRMAALDAPEAYLRTVVLNECRMWLRHHAVEQRHLAAQGGRPESAVTLPPELDEVWGALATLTPRRRIALVLRFYEDQSMEAIAAALGCRVGTARSLVHRGLATLRKTLETEARDGDDR